MRLPFLRRHAPALPVSATSAPDPAASTVPDSTPDSTLDGTPDLVVYGGAWCVDCHVVTRYLDRQRVPYRWVDLARDHEAQERLTAMGYRAIPVVVLPDGRTFVEPTTRELAHALGLA